VSERSERALHYHTNPLNSLAPSSLGADARKALQLAAMSITKMLTSASKETLKNKYTGDPATLTLRVKMAHVMQVIKEIGGSRTQAIEALPHTCKVSE